MLDINLYTINQVNGTERSTLPGLLALTPPRKTARGRENDMLLLFLSIFGMTSMTAANLQSWLAKKGDDFYKTPGTVTQAVKGLIDSINSELLQRNLRKSKEGSQVYAALNLAVIKKETLYLVNIGSTRSFFISADESSEFNNADRQVNGLGVSQTVDYRFIQKTVQNSDTLLFAPMASPTWTTQLFAGSASLSIDAFSRRLFSQSDRNVKAAVIRFSTGKGNISQAVLHNSGAILSSSPKSNLLPAGEEKSQATEPLNAQPDTNSALAVQASVSSVPASPQKNVNNKAMIPVQPAKTTRRRSTRTQIPSMAQSSTTPNAIQVKAGAIAQNAASEVHKVKGSLLTYLQKFIPGLADGPLTLTRSSLIIIAVVVPVLILLLAGTIYVHRGKQQQFNLYLLQAQEFAIQAEGQINDQPSRLASLQQSLFFLDKAESFGQSEASQSLRDQVQGALDVMQGVARLDMKPVIEGGLSAAINISQIVANATEIYILDANSRTAKRYYLNGADYVQDEKFDCGPNASNKLNNIGPLVDIALIDPNNSFGATLIAVDSVGNIQYCVPAKSGVIGVLTQPDQGWKEIVAASYNEGYLYILDPGGNAIYRYAESEDTFTQKPGLFFDNQIPYLDDIFDFEVDGDELYMLRTNGEMVECTYSHIKDYKLTECLDPAPYGDVRTDKIAQTIKFPEAEFIQMRKTSAPDSSIYLLDASGKRLFHFSLLRNLQKILNPRFDDGTNLENLTPTAFTISSSRIVFMAFRNYLYYGTLP